MHHGCTSIYWLCRICLAWYLYDALYRICILQATEDADGTHLELLCCDEHAANCHQHWNMQHRI
jgi:hypothetical protein